MCVGNPLYECGTLPDGTSYYCSTPHANVAFSLGAVILIVVVAIIILKIVAWLEGRGDA